VAVALPALVLLSPIIFALSVLIRLESRGPVLFRQERLGLRRKPFVLYKFRTMIDEAEASTGPVWATPGDKRVTRLGRLLRRSRLDELPQLLNVLAGQMSLVGPRPIRAHFADILGRQNPRYDLRFLVKPGVTGWAQVNLNYPDNEELQQAKLDLDLDYVRRASVILDLKILLRTVGTLLSCRGQ
jgi:lipopolysaccharide/colanic/teichoic acid biosynthesis glycosyltransferase